MSTTEKQELVDLIELLSAYGILMKYGELSIGILGNLTVCIVILCSRSMRTLTDFYLLSLSISDVLFLIFGVLGQNYGLLLEDEYYIISGSTTEYFVCHWISITSIRASLLTITVFTVERYLAVCHPFFIQSMDNKSRITKVISTIWLVAALIALLQTIWQFHRQEAAYNERETELKVLYPYVASMELMVDFILPMLLITVMYILMGIKLHRSSIERQNITSQADKTNKKALMMFAVIIVVFFISWAPQNMGQLMDVLSSRDNFLVTLFLEAISGVTNPAFSVLNPVIYVMMSEKFRKAFKDLLLNCRTKLSAWICTFRNKQTIAEVSLEIA